MKPTGKFSAIMVSLAAPLASRDAREQDYLRWLLGEFFHGINRDHHRRWLRQIARLWNRGGIWTFYPVTDRDGRVHRRHMAIEGRIYANQEQFVSLKAFRLWLKAGAAFGHYEATPAGTLVFVPESVSYEDCSDDEMREFHDDAMAFLHTPHALATLWPGDDRALEDRQAALDALIRNPDEPEDHHA